MGRTGWWLGTPDKFILVPNEPFRDQPLDCQSSSLYTRFGFTASPLGEQQLLLLLKDAKRSLV